MVKFFLHLFFFLYFQLDQTKDLENLNKTLQNRCDQLQNELISLRERSSQG
jgi:hypothetical protein